MRCVTSSSKCRSWSNGPVIIGQMVGCPVEMDLLHDQQWMVISWSWQQLLFTELGGCAIFTAHRLATHPQPTTRSDGVELSYGRLVQNCCVMPYCSCYLYFSLSAIWILHGAVDNNHRVSVIKRALCCCSPTGAHWGNGRCRTPDQQWFREHWGDV